MAVAGLGNKDEQVRIMVAGRDEKTIPRSYITEIIQPRCEELIEIVKNELKKVGAQDEASYGIVLTGGGSQLSGLDRMAEVMLGLPVRVGTPVNVGGIKNIVSDPMYATGVGLLIYAAQTEVPPVNYGDLFGNILKKMKDWVRGFLRR